MICASAIVASAFTALIRVENGSRYIKMQIRVILATGLLIFARDLIVLIGHGSESKIYQIGAGSLTVALNTLDMTSYWLFAHKYWTSSIVIREKKVLQKFDTQKVLQKFDTQRVLQKFDTQSSHIQETSVFLKTDDK